MAGGGCLEAAPADKEGASLVHESALLSHDPLGKQQQGAFTARHASGPKHLEQPSAAERWWRVIRPQSPAA